MAAIEVGKVDIGDPSNPRSRLLLVLEAGEKSLIGCGPRPWVGAKGGSEGKERVEA